MLDKYFDEDYNITCSNCSMDCLPENREDCPDYTEAKNKADQIEMSIDIARDYD